MSKYQMQYQELFIHAPIGIMNSTFEGQLLSVNPAMTKMLGYETPEQLINSIDGDITKLYVDISDRETLMKLLNENYEALDYECQLVCRDKSKIWISLNTNILWNKNHEVIHLQSFVTDITRRKELEQLKEDVDRITYHNFKSPLNNIISVPSVLLSANNLDEYQRKLIEYVQKSGYRILNMIHLSLDMYRMERGEYVFYPTLTDIVPIIKDIKKDLSSLCRSHQNHIFLAVPNNQDKFIVLGDKLLCYIAFSNLIKNAVESTPSGQIVHIQLEDVDLNNNTKTIIHNPDIIPVEIQRKVGQKYITAEKKRGTGLGVYSARLIIETMNGMLKWETSEEEGTYFTVFLPKS